MKSDHTIQIKERLSITDVVGSYVKLERAGNNYKACCPFHNEKTPSFFVVPDKNIFHCFGCGKGGDIFTFVEEIEHCEFPQALTLLAERAGVKLDKREASERGKYDRLYAALELATRYFEVNLRKDAEIVNYLLSRGLTKETIVAFRIGYATDAWQGLADRLREAHVTDNELVETGCAIKKERLFDRFRNRIMFPLADIQGKVIGFSGRVFDARKQEGEMAKYMNSPETALYHKGTMLYALDKAKRAMRETNTCILVEGQFDVVLAHQAGSTNTVALSGTGLTVDHCKLIKRFADTLVLCLDGDEAGLRASRRSVVLALSEGLAVSVLPLPQGDDPASIIARSSDEWHTLVNQKIIPVLDLELSLIQQMPAADRRKHVHENIFPLIYARDSSLLQDQGLIAIAHALAMSPDALRSEFKQWIAALPTQSNTAPVKKISSSRVFTPIMKLLGLATNIKQKNPTAYEKLQDTYERFSGKGSITQALEENRDVISEYAFIAENEYGSDEQHIQRIIEELLLSLEIEHIEQNLAGLHEQVRKSESSETEATEDALRTISELTSRLHELKLQRSVY